MDELIYKQLRESEYPIFIWGTGALSIEVTKRLEENGVSIAGYFTDVVSGKLGYGVDVKESDVWTLEELEERYQKIDVVVGHGHYEKRDFMQKKKFVQHVHLLGEPYLQYQVDVHGEYLEKGKKEITRTLGYLADETSRNALQAYYNFKSTNNIEYLLKGDFFIDGIFGMQDMLYGKDESYLDVGAWKGDTIEAFLNRTSGEYQYVCGIEPELENFQSLEEKCLQWHNVDLYKIGLGNQEGILAINSDNKQSAYLSNDIESGREMVEIKKLDTFLPEKKFTLIKISVAFAFLDILMGGEERIRKDRPKLIVNVAADNRMMVFDTIRWIYSLNLNYKIVLRFDMPFTTRLYLYAY